MQQYDGCFSDEALVTRASQVVDGAENQTAGHDEGQPGEGEHPEGDISAMYARVKRACHQMAYAAPNEDDDMAREIFWHAIDQDIADLADKLEQESRAHDAQEKQGWKNWAQEAIEHGARKAFAFAKGPQPWQPQHTKDEASVQPAKLVQEMGEKCRRLWIDPQAAKMQVLLPVEQRTSLPLLTAPQIKKAGLANPAHKAIAHDGLHPRHLGHMSEEGCQVFAII